MGFGNVRGRYDMMEKMKQATIIIAISVVILLATLFIVPPIDMNYSETVARIEEPFNEQIVQSETVTFRIIINPQASNLPDNCVIEEISFVGSVGGNAVNIYTSTGLSISNYYDKTFSWSFRNGDRVRCELTVKFTYTNDNNQSASIYYQDWLEFTVNDEI